MDAYYLPQDLAEEVWVAVFKGRERQPKNVLLLQLPKAESVLLVAHAQVITQGEAIVMNNYIRLWQQWTS